MMPDSFQQQLNHAEELIIVGEIEAGLKGLATLAAAELSNPQRLLLAEVYYELGHLEQAKGLLKTCKEELSIDFRLLLAEIMLDEGKIEEAWEELQICKEIDPHHLRLLVLLAETYLLFGLPEVAFRYIDQARQVAPHDRTIEDAWYYVSEAAGLKRHVKVDPAEGEEVSLQRLEMRGDEEAYQGHFEEALSFYEKILQSEQSATTLYKAGLMAMQMKEYALAERYLQRVLHWDQEYIQAYRLLGECYFALGQSVDAEEMLARYLMYNPDDASTATQLLRLYIGGSRYEEAEQLVQRLEAYLEDQSSFWYLTGELYRVQGKWQEAVSAYEQTIQLSYSYQDVHWALAMAYQELDQLSQAIQHLRLHLTMVEEDVGAWNDLGFLLLEQGAVTEACTCWERSLRLDGSQGEIQELLQRYQEETL